MEEMKTQEQVHNSVVIDDGRIEALDEFLAPEQLYNDLMLQMMLIKARQENLENHISFIRFMLQ